MIEFDRAVRRQQHGAARRLVDPTRLHAHEAVLDQIDAADAVGAGQLVEAREQGRRRQRFAVDRDRIAPLEGELEVSRLVRRILGRHRPAIHARVRLLPGILKCAPLVGDVQKVGVDRIRRFTALAARDRDLTRARVLDQLAARIEVPFPPRGDHLDLGIERVGAELEPDLVVALARRAMGHGIGADLMGNLDQPLGDQRARDRGAEQVGAFIQRIGAKHRKDVVAHEFLAQVLDEDLRGAHELGLGARRLELLALAQIGGEGHHGAAVPVLQPTQDHGRVEPARVCQNDLVDALCHCGPRSLVVAAPQRGRCDRR